MSRWMAGGVLSALALAGTTILPASSGAQEEDPQTGEHQGEGELTPTPAPPGAEVTASDTACFEGTDRLWWALRPDDAEEGTDPTQKGTVELAEDGSWEATLTAPDEPGDWLFFAICLPPVVAAPDALAAKIDEILDEGTDDALMDAWDVDGYLYYAMILQVEGPTGTSTTTTTPTTTPASPDPVAVPAVPTSPAVPSAAPPATPVQGEPTFAG